MSAGRNARRLTAIAVAAAALALPSAAAAETFRGKTAQGKPVSLETRPDGEVRKVTWRWRTSSCKDSNLRLKTQSTVLKSPRSRKPGRFASDGSYKVRFSDATIRFKVSAAGRQRSPNRWSGTFKAKAIVDLKRGRDTVCKLRRVDWAATT
jgi:hypothetical protein